MKQRGYVTFAEVLVWLAITAIVAGFVVMTPKSCHARWADSEFKTRFGWIKGCQISRDGGKTWIPEDRYREIAN